MSIASPERRHDLDALRVFACYLLFLFHVGMVFNPAPFFHVRNDESSFVFLIVCGFIGLWHMPLLFLLAGWSAAASLRSRGVAAPSCASAAASSRCRSWRAASCSRRHQVPRAAIGAGPEPPRPLRQRGGAGAHALR